MRRGERLGVDALWFLAVLLAAWICLGLVMAAHAFSVLPSSGKAAVGEPFTFSASLASNTSYAWDFADGTTLPPSLDAAKVTHAFSAAGSYTVVLTKTRPGVNPTKELKTVVVIGTVSTTLTPTPTTVAPSSSLPPGATSTTTTTDIPLPPDPTTTTVPADVKDNFLLRLTPWHAGLAYRHEDGGLNWNPIDGGRATQRESEMRTSLMAAVGVELFHFSRQLPKCRSVIDNLKFRWFDQVLGEFKWNDALSQHLCHPPQAYGPNHPLYDFDHLHIGMQHLRACWLNDQAAVLNANPTQRMLDALALKRVAALRDGEGGDRLEPICLKWADCRAKDLVPAHNTTRCSGIAKFGWPVSKCRVVTVTDRNVIRQPMTTAQRAALDEVMRTHTATNQAILDSPPPFLTDERARLGDLETIAQARFEATARDPYEERLFTLSPVTRFVDPACGTERADTHIKATNDGHHQWATAIPLAMAEGDCRSPGVCTGMCQVWFGKVVHEEHHIRRALCDPSVELLDVCAVDPIQQCDETPMS